MQLGSAATASNADRTDFNCLCWVSTPNSISRRITRDARGRRLFPAAPEASLMLRRQRPKFPMVAGDVSIPDSHAYRTLRQWIEQGAPRRVEGEPRLEQVTLEESEFSLAPEESASRCESSRTTAMARHRDVTELTTYLSNQDAVVSVASNGQIEGRSAAWRDRDHGSLHESHLCRQCRHSSNGAVARGSIRAVAAIRFHRRLGVCEAAKARRSNHRRRFPITLFMRRVYLDLIGRLPTVDEARQFIGSDAQDKREALVDQSARARRVRGPLGRLLG